MCYRKLLGYMTSKYKNNTLQWLSWLAYFNIPAVLIFFVLLPCSAQAIELNDKQQFSLINEQLYLYVEPEPHWSASQALNAFHNNAFQQNVNNKVSFGFTKNKVWAVLPVINPSSQDRHRLLKIDNAWLDDIVVYFFNSDGLLRQVSLGDNQPFSQRVLEQRMPAAEFVFPPGTTYLVLSFRSDDPLTIPVYFGSHDIADKVAMEDAYFYGALYGSLFILLIYNVVLYFYLKERRYLYYSAYLIAFTAFNFCYTGHGFWLVWSDSVAAQRWLMPILMFCYLFSGVAFTIEFLHSRVYLPALYAIRHKLYGGLVLLACALTIYGSSSFAVMVQLVILTSLSIWMLSIGYFAHRAGSTLAKFFVPAVIMGTGGATVSSLATWGVIPFSQWAFRGIEIGMLLEMSLLSISLGFNYKLVQEARASAEINARIDPLTNLYNRRAFPELVHPIWELCKRNNRPVSIILIDLDWFKRINDQFGHAVGDDVLSKVSSELRSRLRKSDIPLRWGGEEFLLVLPNTDEQKAYQLAETLRVTIEAILIMGEHRITVSAGVASDSPRNTDIDELIKLADDALYSAKHKGRNQVVVN